MGPPIAIARLALLPLLSACGGGVWMVAVGPPVAPLVVGPSATVAVLDDTPSGSATADQVREVIVAALEDSERLGAVEDLGRSADGPLSDDALVERCREAGAHTMIALDEVETRSTTTTTRETDQSGSTAYQAERTQSITVDWRVVDCAVAGQVVERRRFNTQDTNAGMLVSDQTAAREAADRPSTFYTSSAGRAGLFAASDVIGPGMMVRKRLPKGSPALAEARQAVKARDWDGAATVYQRIVDDEGRPEEERTAAWHGLALVAVARGDLRAAHGITTRAVEAPGASSSLVRLHAWLEPRIAMLDRRQLPVPGQESPAGEAGPSGAPER